jgi:hypothetical protein
LDAPDTEVAIAKRALIETEREEEKHMITKPKQIFAKQKELFYSIEKYTSFRNTNLS